MDNKILGTALIISALLMGVFIFSIRTTIIERVGKTCECLHVQGLVCPMEEAAIPWELYAGAILMIAIFSLGVYLVIFEKSQREIAKILEKQKQIQSDEEKFDLILKGLSEAEKKVMRVVKKQNGIKQFTLKIITGMSKTKLSLVLKELEQKGLIKKVKKGKTNIIYLKEVV